MDLRFEKDVLRNVYVEKETGDSSLRYASLRMTTPKRRRLPRPENDIRPRKDPSLLKLRRAGPPSSRQRGKQQRLKEELVLIVKGGYNEAKGWFEAVKMDRLI